MIKEFLVLNEWQKGEIKEGITEAETGHLVEHETVKDKWTAKLANPQS